jgi:hypothetical protein
VPADLSATFTALKAVLVPYAKRFTVTSNTPTAYTLDEEGSGYRTLFGSVFTRTRDVSFAFYPLQVFRDLVLPTSLAAKTTKTYRYSLKFTGLTKTELRALTRVVEAGWKLVADRRAADPARSYHLPRSSG